MPLAPPFYSEVLDLLQALIERPSLSRQEGATADLLVSFFKAFNCQPYRHGNNVWVKSKYWQADRPTLLLNSHHDTVAPVAGWKRPPHQAILEGDHLFGLGSNDAGGSLVTLIATFLYYDELPDYPFNLILVASAEEEISGANGIASVLPLVEHIDFGIVGEPTQMQMAVAERGLMVIDATANGKAGHAARNEGINALYLALEDIQWLRKYQFARQSEWLGPVKTTVTQIEAGQQHNIVPDVCKYVIDVRINGCYRNEEVFDFLQKNTRAQLKARSFRLQSSQIDLQHPLVRAGVALGLNCFGSPTLSDQALLPFPTIKIGCGDSARSHTADEYIKLSELKHGIQTYIQLLKTLAYHADGQQTMAESLH